MSYERVTCSAYTVLQDEEIYVRVTDHVYGQPLYAWYCLVIAKFLPGEILNTLLDTPLEIFGPFGDREQAEESATSLMNDTPLDSKLG